MFPILPIVLCMSQQRLDVELAARKYRVDDQPVPIMPDVENQQTVYQVRVRESLPHVGKTCPLGVFGQRKPGERFLLNVLRFALQQFRQTHFADHVQQDDASKLITLMQVL